MTPSQNANHQQADLWNRVGGPVWVEHQVLLDRMLAPLETRLTEQAFPGEGRRVLDVGCGAGATTIAMARRLGPDGLALGVDISGPLVEAARANAVDLPQARFIQADAQTHGFETATFDAVISRFGVMFFEDPAAAFANLHRAAKPGAGLAFVAWRGPAENPFMTTAARALAPILPAAPAPDPDAPGQFAFADADRVRRILTDSGWRGARAAALDAPCVFARADLMTYVMNMGPAGAHLREADPATRDTAQNLLRVAFEPFVDGDLVRFNAACWWVTAQA
jgi:SAM-dependent methyltransferase